MSALSLIKASVFAEEYALKNGFLQRLDPRIKVCTLFLFILQGVMTNHIQIVAGLYIVSLVLAFFSQIRLISFLKRTWIFIPLFSLCIAIPALFSVVTPGHSIASFSLGEFHFIITQQGLFGASLFVSRVINSVSYAVLLSLTTRHFDLLKALRAFHIPQIFVMTLGMSYRYIYLFVDSIENTYLAIKSRVGFAVHYRKGQHVVAWNIASLWFRSYHLNEAVYNAMLSRGYRGEVVVLDTFNMKLIDRVWLGFVVLVCAVTLYINIWILK